MGSRRLRQGDGFSPSLEELWQSALENYGLERPSEDTEIHVFRVILQTSLDEKACTRSVTPAGPMSDPLQTLEQIIEEWSRSLMDAQNRALMWSPNKDLLHPVYVLTRKGDPFLQHPHGVMEVSWGHRYWITAVAFPKWINNFLFHFLFLFPFLFHFHFHFLFLFHFLFHFHFHVLFLFYFLFLFLFLFLFHFLFLFFFRICSPPSNSSTTSKNFLTPSCGPMLAQCCAMWCDDTRLREELVECHIGSFVQVHIETFFSDLVRIDLQAALSNVPLTPCTCLLRGSWTTRS